MRKEGLQHSPHFRARSLSSEHGIQRDIFANMGFSSFDCSTCGGHEQFDWTDNVVVALKNVKTNEVRHVLGKYDCYGGVSINVCKGAPGKYDAKGNMTVKPESATIASIVVYHKQFGSRGDCTIAAEEIYCFGAVNGCSFGCGEGLGTRPKVKKAKSTGPPRSARKDVRKDEREDCDGEGRERDHEVEEEEEEEEEEGRSNYGGGYCGGYGGTSGGCSVGGSSSNYGGIFGGGYGSSYGSSHGGRYSGCKMSLLDDDTYQRSDAEVLPLITKQAARQMNEVYRTPLHYAAQNFSAAVVQALLAAYPEAAKVEDFERDTPLHLAAKYSSVAVVQLLLAAYPKAARLTNHHGDTPAGKAKNNPNDEVKAFFASGKHLDVEDDEEEETWTRMCVSCDTAVYSALPQTFAEKLPVYEKDCKALGKAGLMKILDAPDRESNLMEILGMGPLEEVRMQEQVRIRLELRRSAKTRL